MFGGIVDFCSEINVCNKFFIDIYIFSIGKKLNIVILGMRLFV